MAAMARVVAAGLNIAAKAVHRLVKGPIRITVVHREPRVKTTVVH